MNCNLNYRTKNIDLKIQNQHIWYDKCKKNHSNKWIWYCWQEKGKIIFRDGMTFHFSSTSSLLCLLYTSIFWCCTSSDFCNSAKFFTWIYRCQWTIIFLICSYLYLLVILKNVWYEKQIVCDDIYGYRSN